VALAVFLAGCSILPDTGGKGEAAPEERGLRETLAGDAEQAARTLLDAWRDNDRNAADRVTTSEAVNALLGVPYPDAPPRRCRADRTTASPTVRAASSSSRAAV